MRTYVYVCVALLAGCAGPFTELRASAGTSSLGITFCGSSSYRAASVIGAMDGPPSGPASTDELPRTREVTFCIQVDNRGTKPLRVDRSHLMLKCPHETQPWVPDKDEDRFELEAGASRKISVTFQYSPLTTGEKARVLFEDVFSRGEQTLTVAPIVLQSH